MITLLSMPEDRAKADRIVDALVNDNLSVWGETSVPGSPDWQEALAKAEQSRCVIVCWSEAALAESPQAWAYRTAATNACKRGMSIGVLLDKVTPPDDFACTIYDLSQWRLAPSGWRKLLISDAYIRDLVAAARFKQANRDPSPPSAPTKMFIRQAAVFCSAIIVPLLGLLSFTDVLLNFERRMAITPSSEELAAWEALPPGDCKAVRQFVRDFKEGAYSDRANALLAAAEQVERTEWREVSMDEEVYLPHAAGARESDADAEGQRRCEMLVQGTQARKLSVAMNQVRQSCENVAGSNLCDWRGTATCSFEEPQTIVHEVCNP